MAKRSAAMPEQNMTAPAFGGLRHSTLNRIVFLLPCLLGLSTAVAQPEPDMDGSECVDLFDVALFQNQFGTRDRAGIAPCDFHVDGYCNLLDYEILASVLRGPICDCTVDADCNDGYSCTIDDCYSGVCRSTVTCQNQDDTDPDCIHEYCRVAGCVAADEPDFAHCEDGVDCTINDSCHSGQCLPGISLPSCCIPSGRPGCAYDTDCCTTGAHCELGTCCLPLQTSGCSFDSECCDGSCVAGTCCIPTGQTGCYYFADCCARPTGAECTISGTCCLPLQTSGCSFDSECCDGSCVAGTCCITSEQTGCFYSRDCCDDGVACTDQGCFAGQCYIDHDDWRCDDHDADADCIRANCDPFDDCFLAIEPDGSPCEDGIACTGSDYCLAGQCYDGILLDFLCPNQDVCDRDCIQYYCDSAQGCVQGFEPESAPCLSNSCAIQGRYSACNAAGSCECRLAPPDWGCPP